MSYYEARRRELIGDRMRRPKYNAAATLTAYSQAREALLKQERMASAMRRLARIFG